MTRRSWRTALVLLTAASLRSPGAIAAEPANIDPEGGTIVDGVYVNPYFGLRYPLPHGWQAGPQPPRPSYTGYYVLSAPSAPQDAKATILIAAQDTFFATPPIANASAMMLSLARSVPGSEPSAAQPAAVTIAGHAFVRIDLPGTPLSRIVLATDIRCHVVIFTFTGAEPEQLEALAASLDRLALREDPAAPNCVRGYVTAQTIRHKVEPIPAGPQFVKVSTRVIIGADGRAKHIHVIRADAAQQKSIEDALAQWQFDPYRVAGKAAEVETGLNFEFKPGGRAK